MLHEGEGRKECGVKGALAGLKVIVPDVRA